MHPDFARDKTVGEGQASGSGGELSGVTALEIRQAKSPNWFEENGSSFDYAYCSTSECCSDTLELITSQAYTQLKGLKEM